MDLTIWEMDGRPEQADTIRRMNPRKTGLTPSTGHHGASAAEFLELSDRPEQTQALLSASAVARKVAEEAVSTRGSRK